MSLLQRLKNPLNC